MRIGGEKLAEREKKMKRNPAALIVKGQKDKGRGSPKPF